ncbi:CRISPR-associated helicase Cas3' [Thermodesulfatator indicus]
MRELFSHPDIPLSEHLLTVKEKVSLFCQELALNNTLLKTVRHIALTHDLGKATSYFQDYLKEQKVSDRLSAHSLLSAVLSWKLASYLSLESQFYAFVCIASHHRNLGSVLETIYPKHKWDTLKTQFESIPLEPFKVLLKNLGFTEDFEFSFPDFKVFQQQFAFPAEDIPKKIGTYFTLNLLLGMLVDADIRAVVGLPANEKRHEIPENLVDNYLENLPRRTPIDDLRQEFYATVTENIKKLGLENKFFSLTAPTGLGKTLAGFSAAVKLRNLVCKKTGRLPRIIYVLPYTSIIDQNFEVIARVLESAGLPAEVLIKHHFRSGPEKFTENLKMEDVWQALSEERILQPDEALKYYEKVHTQIETWDAEIIVTTFVRFYETLFTNRRSEMRRLHRLAGSIVILDEVQNIPAEYWEATEEALQFLAEKWNTHFILMTATQPALLPQAFELTEPRKQFFFKSLSRTVLNVEPEPIAYSKIEHWLLPKIKSAKNFMVVMNTVRAAQEVYEALKEHFVHLKLYFLSASLIPVHREKRIAEIKEGLENEAKMGVVATQVVEAGVNLDFEIVVRDLAPLDSIVQAAGRCNRHALNPKNGQVFLVNLVNTDHHERRLATYIYDGVLITTTEELLGKYKVLGEKDYLTLVEEYFRKLRDEGRKAQDQNLLASLDALNYDEIAMFDFIKERWPQVPVFVEFDSEASKLIEKLKKLEQLPTQQYEDRMKRRSLFKALAPELWGYVANVPLKVAVSVGLEPLPYASSILWLQKDHLEFEKIYDKETGFTREVNHEAIFL